MKISKINSCLVLLFIGLSFSYNLFAQDVTTIEATSEDISDNLDLEAVASIFGESKDLEDFEKRLNDPKIQISNLDLNNDNEVDYLRIMETAEKNVHSISIQAVIGKDQYQEVAVIDVQKDSSGAQKVQVVGHVDMYGPNYYITPVYPVVPVFFTFFWVASYRPWYSPWYWGYHPPYYNPWRPYPTYHYRNNVHVHVNINNTYNYNNVRINNNVNVRNTNNNAYFKNNPDKSFQKRNPGIENRQALNNTRKPAATNTRDQKKDYQSTGRPVTKPTTTRPTNRPTTNPTTKPTTRPTTRPTSKPSTAKPTNRPANKPTTAKPVSRPSSKPAARPASSKPSSSSYSRQAPSKSSHTRTRR